MPRVADFKVQGDGSAPAWNKTEWVTLAPRGTGRADYKTRIKVLYSATGLYVLMDGKDRQVTATMTEDFLDLWNEDVFEFFIWPDEKQTIYFEYEISPLGFELPILIYTVCEVGLVTPRFLIKHFRYAVLIIFIVSAILTPTPDVFSMCVFATPTLGLYLLGVGAAALSQMRKSRRRRLARDESPAMRVAPTITMCSGSA